LGVFVADEAAAKQSGKIQGGAVGTARAEIGVRTMDVEDPF
jgi:hypothetical protein